MEYIIGIILLITFFGLAFYCIKGYNLMIGFLVMSVLWTVLPLVGTIFASPAFVEANPVLQAAIDPSKGVLVSVVTTLNTIFQKGPEGWGTTLVNVCWGAWFGRVLIETGVASTIIRKTVELGGDRPIVTITLLNVVTAVIFTSMTGAGPVIAIGVIVLPILLSLGIPKAIAMFSFMGSVAAGIYLNPVNFAQYRAFFVKPDEMPEFTLGWYSRQWGFYALLIMLVITTVATAIYLKRSKPVHAWAAQSQKSPDQQNAPGLALITPLIPVGCAIFLNLSVILGFVVSGFFALFLCGKLKGGFKNVCQFINKMYYDGIVDTAPLIGFLLALPMFNAAASLCAPYFRVVVGPFFPQSTLALCVIFTALTAFGLFRGPMTLVGCGAATLGMVSSMGFSVPFLYACFVIPTITMNIGSCITQSWVAWGLAYTKVGSRDFLKLSIPSGWLVSAALYGLTFVVFGRM